jgi:hypothetical protein
MSRDREGLRNSDSVNLRDNSTYDFIIKDGGLAFYEFRRWRQSKTSAKAKA